MTLEPFRPLRCYVQPGPVPVIQAVLADQAPPGASQENEHGYQPRCHQNLAQRCLPSRRAPSAPGSGSLNMPSARPGHARRGRF